ncbi:hypothetical protein, partial [Aeromonas caviae]|uniref:hypothetical protein n=1 Tax=Aeromonas caviae TaxID=648 RepID=UPI0019D47D6D
MNKLHLILDYLLHMNSNKYHLHFIALICPDINNLGHVGGEAGKRGSGESEGGRHAISYRRQ